MKKWIATLSDAGDRSGFIEYGLILAILVTALVGAISANSDEIATPHQRQPINDTDAVGQQSSLLSGLGPLFEMTSGEHRD